MVKCCQNCRDQHAPNGMEPCKTCLDTWAKGGERYTKWSTRKVGDEKNDET